MNREEAKEKIWISKKETYPYSIEDNVDEIIDQIYNYHEAQIKTKDDAFKLIADVYMKEIKAKDEEIGRLNQKYIIQICGLSGRSDSKARSIVAMLFWRAKERKRNFPLHYFQFKDIFKQAYKILKEQQ